MSQTTTTGFEVETAERTTSHQGLHKAIPRYQTVSEFLASCIPQQTDPANCLAAWKQHHPSCKLIFLVRHGETTSNILGYTQGPRVYSPLTLRGQRQVEEFGGFLRKHGKFDWYGSSSLTRAHLTARSLVEFECVYIEEALGEIYSSPLRGVPTCKDNEKIRQIDEWFSERHRQNPLATAYPDFTMADWVKAMGLLKEKMEAGEHRTFLLASHMVAIRWMVAMFLGIPTPPGKKLLGNIANVGVTILLYDPKPKGGWELLVYGDVSFLDYRLRGKQTALDEYVKQQLAGSGKTEEELRSEFPAYISQRLREEEVHFAQERDTFIGGPGENPQYSGLTDAVPDHTAFDRPSQQAVESFAEENGWPG